jgi:hypothetical protein
VFTITNNRPVANGRIVVMAEDTSRSITLTGSDPEGQSLSYNLLTSPTNGTLSGVAPNLTYRPKTNYFGADHFTFEVFDGLTNSAGAQVSLVITQVQDVASVTIRLVRQPGGEIGLQLSAEPYERYRIEASEDLVVWTTLTNILFIDNGLQFIDPDAYRYDHRFYRSAWIAPSVEFRSPTILPSGQFQWMAAGDIGRTCRVEASTNLLNWVTLTNAVLTNSLTPLADPGAAQFDHRFYRLVH